MDSQKSISYVYTYYDSLGSFAGLPKSSLTLLSLGFVTPDHFCGFFQVINYYLLLILCFQVLSFLIYGQKLFHFSNFMKISISKLMKFKLLPNHQISFDFYKITFNKQFAHHSTCLYRFYHFYSNILFFSIGLTECQNFTKIPKFHFELFTPKTFTYEL